MHILTAYLCMGLSVHICPQINKPCNYNMHILRDIILRLFLTMDYFKA